jgi:hypothetical protein
MSFVVGQKYRCTDNNAVLNGRLTTGQWYECKHFNSSQGAITVRDDTGSDRTFASSRFDPQSMAAQNNAANAGASSILARMGWAGVDLSPKLPPNSVCPCGKQTEKKVFTTFEFMYCPSCKKEVGGKAEQETRLTANKLLSALDTLKTPTPPRPAGLPYGIVALKGEKVVCENCGAEHGELADDLPEISSFLRSPWAVFEPVTWTAYASTECCASELESRMTPIWGREEYHVKGRGWV